MNGDNEDMQSRVQGLEIALEKARADAQENWDALLRARAEIENLRKRTAREVDDTRKYAVRELVRALLPVKDSLEKGLAAASADSNAGVLLEGTSLTLRLFSEVLAAHGVSELAPLGERFDPERHEAMDMRHVAGATPNTVVEVYQKGYLLNGRLIRPALVAVSAPGGIPNQESSRM